jgi:hypothetical protein
MKKILGEMVAAGVALLLLSTSLDARVVKFIVEKKRPMANGAVYGDSGPYERLDGVAHFEVDPRDNLNGVIVNLDKARRNAKGMVEFSARS